MYKWYILTQNVIVRKRNQFASGPLLIMRVNYYSKAFGCVGFLCLTSQSTVFQSCRDREPSLTFFFFVFFFCFFGGMGGGVKPPRAPE